MGRRGRPVPTLPKGSPTDLGRNQIVDGPGQRLYLNNCTLHHARAIDPLLQIPAMPDVPEPGPEDLRPFLQGLNAADPYWWR